MARLVLRLDLDEAERRQVEGWLSRPPAPDSVDPALVPREHRMRFLRAAESIVSADGEVTPAEREQLLIFAQLLR